MSEERTNAYKKSLICNLRNQKFDPRRPELDKEQCYCLMGTIVEVRAPAVDDGLSRKPFRYGIDDGTGVITVCHFIHRRAQEEEETRNLLKAAKDKQDLSIVKEMSNLYGMFKEGFEVGTSVEVRGRLQFFNGMPEILALSVKKVEEDKQELDWLEQVLNELDRDRK